MEGIGRYEVVRRLGVGAFATVWYGWDPALSVHVAIKVLADNWSHDADVRQRFLAEARLLRRIADDRVVRVHDIGELPDGRPYFVMDHADGGTLAELVADPPGASTALRLGAESARALQVLHEHGVVHRDVKPSNLLLARREGEPGVLIADLGMAKALADASGFTMTVGTPAYMAPEQAHGTGGFDERADVYATAAVTYGLLTGGPPFATGAGLAGVLARSPEAAPEPVAGDVGAPRDLDVLLREALAHDPSRRPRTALELANRLDGIRRRMELDDPDGVPDGEPASGWTSRALAGLGVATFAVFMAATWLTLRLLG
ncbi:MAG TPA: serine/threonine-protein kinase [Terrabacter sp.]|nr:serine/threonine-protein kinase [Terrabacter sp.]